MNYYCSINQLQIFTHVFTPPIIIETNYELFDTSGEEAEKE